MTYDTQKSKIGRIPVKLFEVDAKSCANTYGVAPCTASGAAGSECYNTRSTCQDPANYSATTKTYKFCETDAPKVVLAQGYIPAIRRVTSKPTKIEPFKGMPVIGSRTISLNDFAHHDRGIDPYASTRLSAPQGTFWGRWIARNKYWIGINARVIDGYVVQAEDITPASGDVLISSGFVLSAPITTAALYTKAHNYVVEKIEGPGTSGVTFTIKDPLKLADGDRATIPVKSEAALAAGITAGDTSLSLGSGEGAAFATYRGIAVSASWPGYVRINDEIIKYTGVSTDTLTGLTRATWGTTAAAHSAGDDVQICWHAGTEGTTTGENVVDLIEEIWTDFTEIDAASYIPSADWAAEKAKWLSDVNFVGIISEPESVRDILESMANDAMLNLWWDDEAQEIKLKSIIPDDLNTATVNYDDERHLLRDQTKVKRLPDKRVSRVYVFFSPRDWTELDQEDMSMAYAQIAATEESADLYGQSRIKKIVSRWIPSQALATQLAGRTLARLKNDPIMIEFGLDAKDDDLQTGDSKTIKTRHIQGVDGSKKATRIQILERQEDERGTSFKFTAQNLAFEGRYAFIGPDGLPGYSSATADQIASYAFISKADGTFDDGTEAYKIL